MVSSRSALVLLGILSCASGRVHRLQKRDLGYPFDTCYERIKTGFGDVKWEEGGTLKYGDNDQLEEAPRSLACFQQCYFVEGKRADPKTHLPSSSAYKALAEQELDGEGDADTRDWFLDISQSLDACAMEAEKDALPKVLIHDDAPVGKDTGFDKELCDKALRLDLCMNRHFKTETMTDRDEFDNVLYKLGLMPDNDDDDVPDFDPFDKENANIPVPELPPKGYVPQDLPAASARKQHKLHLPVVVADESNKYDPIVDGKVPDFDPNSADNSRIPVPDLPPKGYEPQDLPDTEVIDATENEAETDDEESENVDPVVDSEVPDFDPNSEANSRIPVPDLPPKDYTPQEIGGAHKPPTPLER